MVCSLRWEPNPRRDPGPKRNSGFGQEGSWKNQPREWINEYQLDHNLIRVVTKYGSEVNTILMSLKRPFVVSPDGNRGTAPEPFRTPCGTPRKMMCSDSASYVVNVKIQDICGGELSKGDCSQKKNVQKSKGEPYSHRHVGKMGRSGT